MTPLLVTLGTETTKVIGTVRNLGNVGAIFDGVNTAATAPANGILGLGIYNSTEPSPTTGQSVGIQLDSKGRQRMVMMDAAGNTRGANVDANNNLGVVLAAETTKVLGVVRNADGAGNLWTSNSTTFTAKFAQDINILGTLGTAFSTAGKVDIKGADGDVFVRQATGTNLHMVVDSGTITTITNTVNTKEVKAATGANTSVNDTASSVTILAANANRLGATVSNDSSATLFLLLGSTTASATNYTVKVVSNSYYEVPFGFTGQLTGIWATDPNDGAARVTEITT